MTDLNGRQVPRVHRLVQLQTDFAGSPFSLTLRSLIMPLLDLTKLHRTIHKDNT